LERGLPNRLGRMVVRQVYKLLKEKHLPKILSLCDRDSPVPGSLDKKRVTRCHLLLNKKWHLLPPFFFNEPGSGVYE
jgi:hypothetical protein